jgi:hypothetical protein
LLTQNTFCQFHKFFRSELRSSEVTLRGTPSQATRPPLARHPPRSRNAKPAPVRNSRRPTPQVPKSRGSPKVPPPPRPQSEGPDQLTECTPALVRKSEHPTPRVQKSTGSPKVQPPPGPSPKVLPNATAEGTPQPSPKVQTSSPTRRSENPETIRKCSRPPSPQSEGPKATAGRIRESPNVKPHRSTGIQNFSCPLGPSEGQTC